MDSLSFLLVFWIAYGCSNQDPLVSLEERIKSHLAQDPITKQILTKIYSQQDFVTPQFKTMLHLSLNNLLISNEIYASTDPQTSVSLPQVADSVQQENEVILNVLNSDEERNQFKEEYETQAGKIASVVNSKYNTHFTGGYIANYSMTEPLSSLLKLKEIQSPLRVHSMNTLIHRFLGVLELSGFETMSQYPGDDIDFSNKYWSNMLKIYSDTDRTFLGTDTALYLLLKISLQNLAQTRLFRIKATSTLLSLEEKINLIQVGPENSSHRNQLMNAIKRVQAMLSTAQNDRKKTTVASQIQHSTLLQACAHKNKNQFFRENSDSDTGSGQVDDYDYNEPDEPENNSGSCNEYDLLLKHLKTCPSPDIQIPQEITDLSNHYSEIEDSIKIIQETINDLSTEDLLLEVQTLSDFMTRDMSEMTRTLEHITQNYNDSITFFKNFEMSLDTIKETYTYYKLHILVYAGLGGLAILVAVQIMTVFFRIIQCYPLVRDYIADWKAFRQTRLNQRMEGFGAMEQNLPLVPIIQRAR